MVLLSKHGCPSTWRLDSVCRHAPHHMYSIRKYPVN